MGEPTPAAQPPSGKLPPLPLAAAGLTCLNGLITLACFVLFAWDSAASTPIIQSAAPLLVIAGVAGIAAGAIVLLKNKRLGREMDGTLWANPAIVVGLLMMTAAVFLPLLSALAMLVDEGYSG